MSDAAFQGAGGGMELSHEIGPCLCPQAPRPANHVSLPYSFPVSVCLSVCLSFCLGLSLSPCLCLFLCLSFSLGLFSFLHPHPILVCLESDSVLKRPSLSLPPTPAQQPAHQFPPASVLTAQWFRPKEHLCLPVAAAELQSSGPAGGGDGRRSWP